MNYIRFVTLESCSYHVSIRIYVIPLDALTVLFHGFNYANLKTPREIVKGRSSIGIPRDQV